jgi:hypothetical protein
VNRLIKIIFVYLTGTGTNGVVAFGYVEGCS